MILEVEKDVQKAEATIHVSGADLFAKANCVVASSYKDASRDSMSFCRQSSKEVFLTSDIGLNYFI
jgi:hypothetical protein